MLKEALLRTVYQKGELISVVIGGGGLSWITSYFLPIISALTALVTLCIAVVGFKRELRKLKREEGKDG